MSEIRSVLDTKHQANGAIIGMVLGDSGLRKYRNTAMLTRHKAAQRPYLEWKARLLRAYLGGVITEFDNSGYPGVDWYVPATRKLNWMYGWFYKNGKKQVSSHLLNRLTDLGLAIWYMDDGCLALQRKNGHIKARPFTIATHAFGWNGNRIIQDALAARWGLETRIIRDGSAHYIWGNTANTKRLIEIIQPYVSQVPTMLYKIDLQYATQQRPPS